MLFAAGARASHLALVAAGRAGAHAAAVVADEPRTKVAHHGAGRANARRREADRRRLPTPPGQAIVGAGRLERKLAGRRSHARPHGVLRARAAYRRHRGRARRAFRPAGAQPCMLLLFLLLVWRTLAVAHATREPFGRLAAIGVAALLGHAGRHQPRHARGPAADHGTDVAAGELWRLEPAGQRAGAGPGAQHRPAPGYEVTNEPFRFAD